MYYFINSLFIVKTHRESILFYYNEILFYENTMRSETF